MLWLACVPVCTAATTETLPPALFAQLLQDHFSDVDTQQRKPKVDEMSFARIDLNDDGQPEYVVDGTADFCGSRGCTVWIYRAVGSRYVNIYDGNGAVSAKHFAECVVRTRSHGFADLLFKSASGGSVYFIAAAFDGSRYIDYELSRQGSVATP
jgi:hypothetical protein